MKKNYQILEKEKTYIYIYYDINDMSGMCARPRAILYILVYSMYLRSQPIIIKSIDQQIFKFFFLLLDESRHFDYIHFTKKEIAKNYVFFFIVLENKKKKKWYTPRDCILTALKIYIFTYAIISIAAIFFSNDYNNKNMCYFSYVSY